MSRKPYRAEGWENTVVNDADGNTLCAFPGATLEEAKTNAALFTAAPELLEALTDLTYAATHFPGELSKDHYNVKQAEEALRKALQTHKQ